MNPEITRNKVRMEKCKERNVSDFRGEKMKSVHAKKQEAIP